jgi:ribosomal protein L7/L12
VTNLEKQLWIRVYAAEYGRSLSHLTAESQAWEAVARFRCATADTQITLTADELAVAKADKRLHAVKMLRDRTNLPLKEARDIVWKALGLPL